MQYKFEEVELHHGKNDADVGSGSSYCGSIENLIIAKERINKEIDRVLTKIDWDSLSAATDHRRLAQTSWPEPDGRLLPEPLRDPAAVCGDQ